MAGWNSCEILEISKISAKHVNRLVVGSWGQALNTIVSALGVPTEATELILLDLLKTDRILA